MGWFNKKEKMEAKRTLPDLPPLPELPPVKNTPPVEISQLPSFPNNSFNEKFSQNTIKDAVAGKKEVEENADDFEDEDQMMQSSSSFTHVPDFPERSTSSYKGIRSKPMKEEPIFIRLDKFEESLNHFEEIKEQVSEIEKMLQETKAMKEKESAELESWEREIKVVKDKIEKVNREIFSKVD